MLFYVALLLTSLILTLLILWFYKLIVFVARKVLGSSLPAEEFGPTVHLNQNIPGENLQLASKPLGRQEHSTPANLARTHPAKTDNTTPWGWPGNDHDIREQHTKGVPTNGGTLNSYLVRSGYHHQVTGNWKEDIGPASRDERPGLTGKAYQPSRGTLPDYKSNISDKPWGW